MKLEVKVVEPEGERMEEVAVEEGCKLSELFDELEMPEEEYLAAVDGKVVSGSAELGEGDSVELRRVIAGG